MGSMQNHEWPSPENPNSQQRKIELLRREIEAAAKAVAVDHRRPWELLALRERARQHISQPGALEAWKDHDQSLGLSFPHQQYIRKALFRCEVSTPSPPSAETVGKVYAAFSSDEWKYLVADLDWSALEPLVSYLQTNEDALTQNQETRIKYGYVFDAAVRRRLTLKLSQGKWEITRISDPLWAAVWWERSRRRARQCLQRPSKRRSGMEMASDRAVAEALGYDPENRHKQVASWRKRMKEVHFERYVEKFGGNCSDYLLWVRNPRLHQKIQRLRKHREG